MSTPIIYMFWFSVFLILESILPIALFITAIAVATVVHGSYQMLFPTTKKCSPPNSPELVRFPSWIPRIPVLYISCFQFLGSFRTFSEHVKPMDRIEITPSSAEPSGVGNTNLRERSQTDISDASPLKPQCEVGRTFSLSSNSSRWQQQEPLDIEVDPSTNLTVLFGLGTDARC